MKIGDVVAFGVLDDAVRVCRAAKEADRVFLTEKFVKKTIGKYGEEIIDFLTTRGVIQRALRGGRFELSEEAMLAFLGEGETKVEVKAEVPQIPTPAPVIPGPVKYRIPAFKGNPVKAAKADNKKMSLADQLSAIRTEAQASVIDGESRARALDEFSQQVGELVEKINEGIKALATISPVIHLGRDRVMVTRFEPRNGASGGLLVECRSSSRGPLLRAAWPNELRKEWGQRMLNILESNASALISRMRSACA